MVKRNSNGRAAGLLSVIRRGIRHAALRRGIFIGRVTAPGAPNTPEAHLSYLLSALGINCVLDVGAHKGEFCAMLRELGYTGPIRSFEPVAAHFERLQARMAGDAQWRGFQIALGTEDRDAEIHVTRSSTFASFLGPSDYGNRQFHDDLESERDERVPVRRLDGIWDECMTGIEHPVVLLKIDTQGMDLEVVRGAGDRLAAVSAIQTEVSLKPIYSGMTTGLADSLGQLKAMGFEPTAFAPVSRDPVDHLRLIEMDCMLIRVAPGASPAAGVTPVA